MTDFLDVTTDLMDLYQLFVLNQLQKKSLELTFQL